MNLHKTKIDWATHTWNPVTGCLHDCEYCYARRFISRFAPHACERPEQPIRRLDGTLCYQIDHPARLVDERGDYVRSTPYPKGFEPMLSTYTLDYPAKRKIPSRVFVSSMGDLFGGWVPNKWIERVFEAAKAAPQHKYLFLTKNPKRYYDLARCGKLPGDKNFWYGTTVTKGGTAWQWCGEWSMPKAWHTFLSIEPLLDDVTIWLENGGYYPDWLIVGAMTGPGSKDHQPRREWVENLVRYARERNIPLFMKGNLKAVWGDDLIQEYPPELL